MLGRKNCDLRIPPKRLGPWATIKQVRQNDGELWRLPGCLSSLRSLTSSRIGWVLKDTRVQGLHDACWKNYQDTERMVQEVLGRKLSIYMSVGVLSVGIGSETIVTDQARIFHSMRSRI